MQADMCYMLHLFTKAGLWCARDECAQQLELEMEVLDTNYF